jgi:hypothetical protein
VTRLGSLWWEEISSQQSPREKVWERDASHPHQSLSASDMFPAPKSFTVLSSSNISSPASACPCYLETEREKAMGSIWNWKPSHLSLASDEFARAYIVISRGWLGTPRFMGSIAMSIRLAVNRSWFNEKGIRYPPGPSLIRQMPCRCPRPQSTPWIELWGPVRTMGLEIEGRKNCAGIELRANSKPLV